MHCFNACMVELEFQFRCCSVNLIAQRPGFNHVPIFFGILIIWVNLFLKVLYANSFSYVGGFLVFKKIIPLHARY